METAANITILLENDKLQKPTFQDYWKTIGFFLNDTQADFVGTVDGSGHIYIYMQL